MTYEDARADGFAEGKAAGINHVLTCFFGATCVVANDDRITCTFKAKNGDAEERRRVIISPKKSPEDNMAVIADALRRKYWYEQQREETEGIDRPSEKDIPEKPPGKETNNSDPYPEY